ncbi:MAG: hypothetical protein WCA46_03765 [Actinocatenispora sp.]
MTGDPPLPGMGDVVLIDEPDFGPGVDVDGDGGPVEPDPGVDVGESAGPDRGPGGAPARRFRVIDARPGGAGRVRLTGWYLDSEPLTEQTLILPASAIRPVDRY